MVPTAELRSLVRRKTGESIPEGGSAGDTMISEVDLDAILVDALSVNHAIIEVWELKLAAWASLVDVTDGASSRKFSDLRENAESMIKYYRGLISGSADRLARARVGKIVRK